MSSPIEIGIASGVCVWTVEERGRASVRIVFFVFFELVFFVFFELVVEISVRLVIFKKKM
jgi:hypothetical protein